MTAKRVVPFVLMALLSCQPQSPEGGPVASFPFDGNLEDVVGSGVAGELDGVPSFVAGLQGQAVQFGPEGAGWALRFAPDGLPLHGNTDFSVQFWMRTDAPSDRRFVLLSKKAFPDNSLASQKEPGWVLYTSGGTWAWSMGSGDRRVTYERENGQLMPLNDGRWHQVTMTFSEVRSEIRLYYDGVNWASYHVQDSNGFDFSNQLPLALGWDGERRMDSASTLASIQDGAALLQALVDEFELFGLGSLTAEDLIHLVVDPERLFDERVEAEASALGAGGAAFLETMANVDFQAVEEAEAELMANPFTVHQNLNFMVTAPLSKVYSLVDGEIVVLQDGADVYAERERLHPPNMEIDNLSIWDRVLTPSEINGAFSEFFQTEAPALDEALARLNAGAWNIWHGGKHWTLDDHGWDSRIAIADLLREESVDVVMMQETYSSGDFIAAELGYYFATTVDWDYLNQGSNISVLSRFPILDIHVEEDSPFQNVGTKVAISRSQDIYVMSNWYGMAQFPAVFDFHRSRFQESDEIPTLFAGDFNAVPHTDGGDSPASVALLEAGFTDAYRSLFPDVEAHPGPTHRSGRRIDQLYFKGVGMTNVGTQVISEREGGFPSDHFLILSSFDLDYSTYQPPRLEGLIGGGGPTP